MSIIYLCRYPTLTVQLAVVPDLSAFQLPREGPRLNGVEAAAHRHVRAHVKRDPLLEPGALVPRNPRDLLPCILLARMAPWWKRPTQSAVRCWLVQNKESGPRGGGIEEWKGNRTVHVLNCLL